MCFRSKTKLVTRILSIKFTKIWLPFYITFATNVIIAKGTKTVIKKQWMFFITLENHH